MLAPFLFTACNQRAASTPGTPEYAASVVSRGYDCGLKVERGRVAGRYRGEEHVRFVQANQSLAVQSYNRPRHCDGVEAARVRADLRAVAGR